MSARLSTLAAGLSLDSRFRDTVMLCGFRAMK